jgi:hypothetical protein
VVTLAGRFIPAADEVGRLQRVEDVDGALFRAFAEQGHYAGRVEPSDTRQGIYATAPSGVLLASINTREPRAVADMLRSALARWDELAPEERLHPALPAAAPRRFEARYPEDGLVLRVVARDVERTERPHGWRGAAWNQDFAWFTRAEALALVPEEAAGDAPAARAWPAELAQRLARLHLLDLVRGQVTPFRAEDVEWAELTSTRVAAEGERVELALAGRTRTEAVGSWAVDGFADAGAAVERTRGFEAELLGRATFDRAAGRFVRFELVAIGTRWGGTQFNGRGDDLEPAPMGLSLTLAGTGPAERVAPARIWEYGWPPP